MQKTQNGGGASISEHAYGQLVQDEIRAIVADAVSSKQLLRVGKHAKRLSATYPSSGFSQRRLIDEIIAAASAAKVPVEIDRA